MIIIAYSCSSSWCGSPSVRHPRENRGLMCESCRSFARQETTRKYRERQKAKPDYQRGFLAYQHRITETDFMGMVEAQDGKCAGCLREADLHIDHDHSCCPGGKSCPSCRRGLLCRQCNMALGLLADDPERMARLVKYVQDWAKVG